MNTKKPRKKKTSLPKGKLKIEKIFINKTTGQMTIVLPKRKMKNKHPKNVEVSYW